MFDNKIDARQLGIRIAKNLKSLVTSEISRRLEEQSVDTVGLDAAFMERCEERHGLGRNIERHHVDQLKVMALKRFEAFRMFYGLDPGAENLRSLEAPFASGFIKSDYSIWADIIIKQNCVEQYLCGTLDAAYWINESANKIGLIIWNTSDNIESSIRIMNRKSPFSNSDRTLLQRCKCQSHLLASILETKYNFTVTANIVHLRDHNFVICPVEDWRNCECVSLFELK